MNKKLKSSFELAMERMKSNPGFQDVQLSDEQKNKINELRKTYQAKIAEREIMFNSKLTKLSGSISPAELAVRKEELEVRHREDIQILKNTMEEKIRTIRES